nr:HD domain-containing protein [bacterium]
FTKPFNSTLLQARIGALLERKRLRDSEDELRHQVQEYNLQLEVLVEQQVRLIAAGHISTIFAMSKLAESRDQQTGLHLERMREYCRILAQYLQSLPKYSDRINNQYIEALYAASPLHDIGKVAIPDSILLKPGKHTPEERKVMESHAVIGAETLRQVYDSHRNNDLVSLGIQIAESHHEHWDGTGYPFGRSGEDIPLSARILALADVYDALRAERVYKPSFSHTESRVIILNGSGTHFDPAVVEAFVATEAEFISVKKQWDELSLTS